MGIGALGIAGDLGKIAKADQRVGCDVTRRGVVDDLLEPGGGLGGFPLRHEFGSEAGKRGGSSDVGRIGSDEIAQSGDGGVLLAGVPLLLGKQHRGAAGGLGAGMFLQHRLQRRQILGLAESGAGGLLAAVLDAAIHDQRGGGDHQHDGEYDQVFLVAIEKLLECAWGLRDFCERGRG